MTPMSISPKMARRNHVSGSMEDVTIVSPLQISIKNSPLARTTSLGFAEDKGSSDPITPRQSQRGDSLEALSRASSRELKEKEKEEEKKRKEEKKREEEKKKEEKKREEKKKNETHNDVDLCSFGTHNDGIHSNISSISRTL